MMAEKSLRFARNVTVNVLGQAVLAAVNFFAIPYLVRRLGVETYGLYVILHAAASYLMLASFGAGSALLKHVAAAWGARDGRALRDALSYAGWVLALGALLGGSGLALGARFVATRVFHVPPHLTELAVFVLRCVAAAGVFVALTQGASSAMQGLQRFDGYNAVVILQNGLMPLGAVALVAAGLGLGAVAGWYAALNAVVCAAAVMLAWRLLRTAREHPAREGLRPKAFALWALTSWFGCLAWIVANQFDKLFIARQISLSALTLYSVPAGLLQRLQFVPAMVATVVIPIMSELQGEDVDKSLRRMYYKATRFVLWVCLPVLVTLFALMPQFLSLWLSGQFSDASCWPARLLVLAQVCAVLNALPNTVTFSRDHPWFAPAWAWSQALLSLLAWKLLIPHYGLMGVALGSLAALAIPTALNLWLVNRKVLRLPLRDYAAEALFAPFLSAALMLAALMPVHAWAVSWLRLLACMAAGAAVFYGSTWLMLSADDRALLRRYLAWERRG